MTAGTPQCPPHVFGQVRAPNRPSGISIISTAPEQTAWAAPHLVWDVEWFVASPALVCVMPPRGRRGEGGAVRSGWGQRQRPRVGETVLCRDTCGRRQKTPDLRQPGASVAPRYFGGGGGGSGGD